MDSDDNGSLLKVEEKGGAARGLGRDVHKRVPILLVVPILHSRVLANQQR